MVVGKGELTVWRGKRGLKMDALVLPNTSCQWCVLSVLWCSDCPTGFWFLSCGFLGLALSLASPLTSFLTETLAWLSFQGSREIPHSRSQLSGGLWLHHWLKKPGPSRMFSKQKQFQSLEGFSINSLYSSLPVSESPFQNPQMSPGYGLQHLQGCKNQRMQ